MSFYKKYLLLNLNEYDSFAGFDFYISFFIGILSVCLCIGIFIANSRKNTMINMIKQLYRHGALNESSAKTLKELRVKNTFILRRMLSVGTRLSRIVMRVGARTFTYEEYVEEMKAQKKQKKRKLIAEAECDSQMPSEKIDFSSAAFYISTERELEAKSLLSKNVTSVWQNILISIFFICLSICLIFLMPEILHLIDSFLS